MKIQAWPGKAVTHQFIINSCQILGNWPEDSFSIIPSYLLQLNFLLFKNKECFFSLYLILISVECKSRLKWLAVYKALVHAIFWDRAQNILNEGKEGDMPGISCQKSRTVIQGPCAVVSQGQGMRKRKWNGTYRGLEMAFVHTVVFLKNFFKWSIVDLKKKFLGKIAMWTKAIHFFFFWTEI